MDPATWDKYKGPIAGELGKMRSHRRRWDVPPINHFGTYGSGPDYPHATAYLTYIEEKTGLKISKEQKNELRGLRKLERKSQTESIRIVGLPSLRDCNCDEIPNRSEGELLVCDSLCVLHYQKNDLTHESEVLIHKAIDRQVISTVCNELGILPTSVNQCRYDFVVNRDNIKMIIEFDGEQHFSLTEEIIDRQGKIKVVHSNEEMFRKCQAMDICKTILALRDGYKVFRIDYSYIDADICKVQELITTAMDSQQLFGVTNKDMYGWFSSSNFMALSRLDTQFECKRCSKTSRMILSTYFKEDYTCDSCKESVPQNLNVL
jgi:very-short-patch-repair endonuclease